MSFKLTCKLEIHQNSKWHCRYSCLPATISKLTLETNEQKQNNVGSPIEEAKVGELQSFWHYASFFCWLWYRTMTCCKMYHVLASVKATQSVTKLLGNKQWEPTNMSVHLTGLMYFLVSLGTAYIIKRITCEDDITLSYDAQSLFSRQEVWRNRLVELIVFIFEGRNGIPFSKLWQCELYKSTKSYTVYH